MSNKIASETTEALRSLILKMRKEKEGEIRTAERHVWDYAEGLVTDAFYFYQSAGEDAEEEEEEEEKEEEYTWVGEIRRNMRLYAEWIRSSTKVTYEQWLEKKLINKAKKATSYESVLKQHIEKIEIEKEKDAEEYTKKIYTNWVRGDAKLPYRQWLERKVGEQEKKKVKKIKLSYFDGVLGNRINMTRKVMTSKAKEYASSTDRFHNFRQAAIMNDTTPEKALWGMLSKHLVSVQDMVESTPEKPSVEYIDEKIGDTINYLILLEGLLKEGVKK